ncbi:MAG: FtsX-like permease family protein [Chitinophagaceae bacterium]|nr:FtsX-like permease family protein [Chitinophagaceae bacterium]
MDGHKRSLLTLGFIGLLIILMACINFVNLSTALAVKRSKEVGIRKVMGGNTRQLQLQVFAETFIVVSIATVLALFLAWLSLPYIKSIMVVQDKLSLLSSGMVLFVLGITLITAFLSGLYPAIVMGRFQPVEAIKNKINTAKVGSVSLRRVLVVLQFSFSQILVIATIIAISQMSFIRNVDLGFNKEAVLMISGNSDSVSHSRMMAFRDALQSRSDVKSVSFSFDAPSSDNSWQSNFAFDIMEDKDFPVALKMGDENYLKTYDIKLLAGRNYKRSDTATEYIINETMLKKVGLKTPQEAIGKMLRLGGSEPKPVIGVVKDFKLQSLKEAISPIVLMPRTRFYSSTGIKLDSKNLAASKAAIEGIWNKFYPEYVFNAKFLDDNIQEFYIQEERLSTMYKVCALLALFISCLGLYGLISFMVVQKTREVGIRKVLGAGVNSILYLFSKEFTILIIISFVLAVPAAWYLMHTWLQDFVYRVDMGPLVFIGALLLTLVIAWITVGYKALKAALANPVKSLRTE